MQSILLSRVARTAATAAPTAAFTSYLNSLTWDDVLCLTVATDDYYYTAPPPSDSCGGGTGNANPSSSRKEDGDGAPNEANAAKSASSPPSPQKKQTAKAERKKKGRKTGKEDKGSQQSLLSSWRSWLASYVCSSSKTRLFVKGITAWYVVWALTHRARCVPILISDLDVEVHKMRQSCPQDLSGPELSMEKPTSAYLFQSTEGVQLVLRAPLSVGWTLLHDLGGVLMLILSVMQKDSVSGMTMPVDVSAESERVPAAPLEGVTQSAAMNAARGGSNPASTLYQYHALQRMGGGWGSTAHMDGEESGHTQPNAMTPSPAHIVSSAHAAAPARAAAAREEEANTSAVQQRIQATRNVFLHRQRHCIVGTSMVLLMSGMAALGYKLRSNYMNSINPPMEAADVGDDDWKQIFVTIMTIGRPIPWFAPVFGVAAPVLEASSSTSQPASHAVLGSVLCKACLWVPLSRLLALLCQRCSAGYVSLKGKRISKAAPLAVAAKDVVRLERAYNIASVVALVVIGLWTANDLRKLLVLVQKIQVQRQVEELRRAEEDDDDEDEEEDVSS